MIEGTFKCNALAVGEFAVQFKGGGNVVLTAKAAFIDLGSGSTHGWTHAEGAVWSKETIEQVHLLREMLERDLALLHFAGSGPTTTPGMAGPAGPVAIGGIGEHLGEADQL